MWWRLPILLGILYLIVNLSVDRKYILRSFEQRAPAPTFFNETGSYYRLISQRGITWHEAVKRAESMTYGGRRGHLLTIDSSLEDSFLQREFKRAENIWIGASDSETEGHWKWVTGPEAGKDFYLKGVDNKDINSTISIVDENPKNKSNYIPDWAKDEPNNLLHSGSDEGEDYAMWAWQGRGWNDVRNNGSHYKARGFIVEFPGPPQSFSTKNMPPIPANLVQAKSVWRYLDDGSDQGTAWRNPGFDDSKWRVGRAELGYGDNNETTRISYGRNSNRKNITNYFRLEFHLDSLPESKNLLLSLIRDDGAAVYLNGQELLRVNLAKDAKYNQPAEKTIDRNRENSWNLHLVNGKNLLQGENILAVEVHQSSRTSSDISFDLALGMTDLSDLVNALASKDPATMIEILKIIRKISPADKKAIPYLLSKLFDKDSSVVLEAARALGDYDEAGKIAIPQLRTLMRSSREDVRIWATVALLQIDRSLNLEILKQSGLPLRAKKKTINNIAAMLNSQAWSIVSQAETEENKLNKAFKEAHAACKLHPENGSFLNTLGVAQYRLGKYDEALQTISQSHDLNGGVPTDIAFLTMIHHQLGNDKEAKQSLAALQTLMKSSRWKKETQANSFLQEASQLLNTSSESIKPLSDPPKEKEAEPAIAEK